MAAEKGTLLPQAQAAGTATLRAVAGKAAPLPAQQAAYREKAAWAGPLYLRERVAFLEKAARRRGRAASRGEMAFLGAGRGRAVRRGVGRVAWALGRGRFRRAGFAGAWGWRVLGLRRRRRR